MKTALRHSHVRKSSTRQNTGHNALENTTRHIIITRHVFKSACFMRERFLLFVTFRLSIRHYNWPNKHSSSAYTLSTYAHKKSAARLSTCSACSVNDVGNNAREQRTAPALRRDATQVRYYAGAMPRRRKHAHNVAPNTVRLLFFAHFSLRAGRCCSRSRRARLRIFA